MKSAVFAQIFGARPKMCSGKKLKMLEEIKKYKVLRFTK